MLYTSITLCGYRRLALNHINFIEIKPINKIQLILGTNGSGKSSILRELSPLPGNPSDFNKDGYKIVELTHKNSHYVLKSIFGLTKNEYSFVKDGDELNTGNTASTFRELVKQEFNITQDVHDMMTGYMPFHAMSVAERRTWFTKISDADYTYAIRYYKKLSEQLRDIVGAIKLNQSRLVQESEKLLKPEEEEIYRYEIVKFNEMLAYLLELKSPVHVSKEQIEQSLVQQDHKLNEISAAIRQHRATFMNEEGFTDIDSIDSAIIDVQSNIQTLTLESQRIYGLLEQQQSTIDSLKESNVASFSDIDTSIDKHLEDISSYKRQIHLQLSVDDPTDAHHSLLSVHENLTHIFSSIEENKDKRYSRDSYVRAVNREKELSNEIKHTEKHLNDAILKKKEYEHLKSHDKLECPECKHSWHQGYDERKYQTVLAEIERVSSNLVGLNDEHKKAGELLQSITSYLELYRAYSGIVSAWTPLKPLWDHIETTGILFEQPKQIITVLETFKYDLELMIKVEKLGKELDKILEIKELLSKDQETSMENLIQQNEKLHQQQSDTLQRITEAKTRLEQLKRYKDSAIQIQSLDMDLAELFRQREAKSDQLLAIVKRDALNESIQLVQMELMKREQMISMIDNQRAVIYNLQLQNQEYQEKVEVLKLAVKELSPTEGLIAKGLTGFINHFIHQLNSFIKKIWLYPLELIPIEHTSEDGIDLDYRFLVKVNDKSIIPDISKGSGGMMEVIDLAFRIVNMQYLGLQDAPLILDEFGAKLDSAHRQSANYVITNLLTSANFSQIYMVSHYEDSYGSLVNSDVLVLCPSNIVLPKNMSYNQHAVIK